MNLEDLFPIEDLEREIADGYVSRRLHPRLPLQIFNYTAQAQWENHWTPVTRACRGLIAELLTHKIVARPFEKFFNLGQEGATIGSGPFRTYEKMDGSLGILYPTPDGHAIATRGSFESEQAIRGTAIWQKKYADIFDVPQSVTFLFEIIYPENRIVIDYLGDEDLYLLAAIDTESGRDVSTNLDAIASFYFWPGPVALEYAIDNIDEARAALETNDAVEEGFVLVWQDGSRVKMKTDEYLRLHRLLTGMTPRRIWEHLAAGESVGDLIERTPDEFTAWAERTADGILSSVYEIESQARLHADAVTALGHPDRRSVAEVVTKLPQPYPGLVFSLIDGKPIRDRVWKLVRPAGTAAFKIESEDTA